jgi:hypothetical protein
MTPTTQSAPNPSLSYRDGVEVEDHDQAALVHGWGVAHVLCGMR